MGTLDIHWTTTLIIPELADMVQTLREIRDIGERLVDTVASIIAEVQRLNENLVAGDAALAEQVTRIADEVAQWQAGAITQEQIDNLGTALRAAADSAEQQVANIQANTAAIGGIVPDTPA